MQKLGGRNWRAVVGLTGGLGSGKSTVLSLFKRKGAFVLDSDEIVHRLLGTSKILSAIKRKFGSQVFDGKKLNKKKLAGVIFTSSSKRKTLEKMIHPEVRKAMAQALLKKKGKVAVCDVPLLYEGGWNKSFKTIIVVGASLSKRIKRLRKRGFSAAESRARIRAQWPLSIKMKKADFVVNNDNGLNQTKNQVDLIWKRLSTE